MPFLLLICLLLYFLVPVMDLWSRGQVFPPIQYTFIFFKERTLKLNETAGLQKHVYPCTSPAPFLHTYYHVS